MAGRRAPALPGSALFSGRKGIPMHIRLALAKYSEWVIALILFAILVVWEAVDHFYLRSLSNVGFFISVVAEGLAILFIAIFLRRLIQKRYRQILLGKEQLAYVLENIREGVIVTDISGRIAYANRKAGEMYGFGPREMIGMSFRKLQSPANPSSLFSEMYRATLQDGWEGEFIGIRRDGKEFPISAVTSGIKSRDGEIIALVGIFRDISEERRLQQLLLESEKLAAVGQATAEVAHEIKNPLVSIGGLARFLQGKLHPDNPYRDVLKAIVDEVERLEEILKQILDFSRGTSPKMGLEDLNAIVKRTLELIKHEIGERPISLDVSLSGRIPRIMVDRRMIQQMLINLMKNAVDAMPEGGRLSVSTSMSDDGFAQMVVSDTGVGMEEDQIERIFLPFFSTKDSGTGLGLSIVKQIVVSHGGSIEINSRRGKGTTVTVSLPLNQRTFQI